MRFEQCWAEEWTQIPMSRCAMPIKTYAIKMQLIEKVVRPAPGNI